jgi:glycosyltransferase involved in cell wall biosynthesis
VRSTVLIVFGGGPVRRVEAETRESDMSRALFHMAWYRPAVRICLVYDCLYPYTVGGAERWYRNLAAELVAAGHEVTYLTRRQWPEGEAPDLPGVEVVAVSPGGPLYTESGRRRIVPPLRFGLGVLRHLLGHRRAYDAVHSCAFPFFSLLAVRAALAGRGTFVAIDWFEVWTPEYWRGYLGGVGGRIGHAVQRACVRLTPHAFVFSRLHARRLRDEGLRTEPVVPGGLYAGSLETHAAHTDDRPPLVVFAGRHIREKRADLVPATVAAARRSVPELQGLVLGDGPERTTVLAAITDLGLEGVVEAPGFVEGGEVDAAFERATCLLLPSEREGYGLVVIEAAAAGTPSVLAAGPDNAAVELVDEGVNGFVAPAPEPEALARAVVAAHRAGAELRASTADWFSDNAPGLSAAASARRVVEVYDSAR